MLNSVLHVTLIEKYLEIIRREISAYHSGPIRVQGFHYS